MADTLDKFKETLPYATELFGVYQPLIGWKSRQAVARVNQQASDFVEATVGGMIADARVQQLAVANPKVVGPTSKLTQSLPWWLMTRVGSKFLEQVKSFVDENKKQPEPEDWLQILRKLDADAILTSVSEHPAHWVKTVDPLNLIFYRKKEVPAETAEALGAYPIEGTDLLVRSGGAQLSNAMLAHEAVVAGMLQHLAERAPAVLAGVVAKKVAVWETNASFVDPLAGFDPETQKAVLSPLGMVNLFREYFFEFDSFLGPPVGHVWISPGGSLELYEVHTRRTVEDRMVEIGTETITKSETSLTNQDELSTAVSEDNSRNISLGVTVSAGANTGVYHADASATLGMQINHQSSEQVAHKQMRQQSEKLSNEIRRNFKTTYRTTVEAQDTSSRRYVLQNTTEALVNYELRRKMRKVGVQVQHISTQLCWQLYADNPGSTLGISELVHLAKRDDISSSIQPPEAPSTPPSKTTDMQINFDYQNTIRDDNSVYGPQRNDDDNRYVFGTEKDRPGAGEAFNKIIWERIYDAPPPMPGYELASLSTVSADKVDASQGVPTVAPRYTTHADDPSLPVTSFKVSLDYLIWSNQNSIRLTLRLVWVPPKALIDAAVTAYQQKVVEFTEEKKRAVHADYLGAVRERIKLESKITPRRSDDLREEERTIIYRWLLQQLTKAGANQTPHVTAELIRSIFDVDKMLYFVAPEWWLPRKHYHQQTATPKKPTASTAKLVNLLTPKAVLAPAPSPSNFSGSVSVGPPSGVRTESSPAALPKTVQTLSFDDVVGWGGVNEENRDNYLITEDSEPAPLGASLGWLIQLDGDSRRNTFLNSPWVKAILPIRPGKEEAALNWLTLAHVEGTDGLDEAYQGNEGDLQGLTIKQAVLALGKEVATLNTDMKNVLATETVYEKGFDPLQGGFQATGTAFEIFDQWIEVLPTDQTVAVEYEP